MDTPGRERPRILVADDDPLVRMLAQETLESAGFRVDEAADGREAWERLLEGRPDLVLLDVLMPGEDGFDVLRRIRAHEGLGRTPVLVITALDDLDSIEQAYRLGATDFATKPLNWTILAHRIRYVLRAHRNAEELRRHKVQLAEAQRIAGLGCWAWHPATGRMSWSEELHRIWGRTTPGPETMDALLGRVPAGDRQRLQGFLEDAARGRGTGMGPLEHRLVGEDGVERIVRHRVAPAGDLRDWVLGTVQDVTRDVEMERRLRQAEKLEALGTMAGGIAHDFNNLLAPIVGFVELAIAELPENAPVREHLCIAAASARRARDLVRQVLEFGRGSGDTAQPVDLAGLAREVLGLLASSAPAGVRVRWDGPEGGAWVRGDPVRLHQMIMNLCKNGLQALDPGGGELCVRVRHVCGGKGCGLPAGLAPGRYVCLEVRDTGCGMTPEVLRRAFEPFFTTRPVGRGTGLGLSVVHGVVKAHGGAVDVESRPGGGTCFRVFLPRAPGEVAREPGAPAATPSPGRARILVVDDEEPLLRFMRHVLERAGHRVETFREGGRALHRLMEDPGGVDLLIADQAMPGISGLDLVREARRVRPDLPVILCTGWVPEDGLEGSGVRRVLQKPMGPEELLEAVDRVLGEGAPGAQCGCRSGGAGRTQ